MKLGGLVGIVVMEKLLIDDYNVVSFIIYSIYKVDDLNILFVE